MNVVFCSAFRNSAHSVDKYYERIIKLRELWPTDVYRVIAGEGDSKDETRRMIELNAKWSGIPTSLLDVSHGGPVFGSTEAPARLTALSKICNTMLSFVKPADHLVVYIESDLLWEPATIRSLITHALDRTGDYDVFAPMVYADLAFYDIWGFRQGGERFHGAPPFHRCLIENTSDVIKIDSAGSCLVMRANVARECRIHNDYGLVGWCEDARTKGYKIAVCRKLGVRQP